MHVLYRLNLVCVSITTLFKKRLRHSCLPVNFSKDLKTTIIQNTSNGLFLIVSHFSSDISSHPEVFYKKSNRENFAKFTRNPLCQSFVFSKVASTLLKKRLWHRCFPVNFAKFLRTPFFYRTPQVGAYENANVRNLRIFISRTLLPHFGSMLNSYRNQSVPLLSKSIDWFLERNIGVKWFNVSLLYLHSQLLVF